MDPLLETAGQQIQQGQYKDAVKTLWKIERHGRDDVDTTRALIELTDRLQSQTTGRLERECAVLANRAKSNLFMLGVAAREDEKYRDAVAVVRNCRVLGGHGLPADPGEIWELIFTDTEIRMRGPLGRDATIPYSTVTAIEIGGPGARKTGGGFTGGGFGIQGAAEGMLIASALNMLTTKTSVDTVICVQTLDAELFVHHGEATPDALRIRLSPIFTVLRQRAQPLAPAPLPADSGSTIDRLAKLSDLLDRGLIDEDEFRRLKSEILG